MNLRNGTILDLRNNTKPPERIERKLNEKDLEGLNGVVEKINNERISLLWTYR